MSENLDRVAEMLIGDVKNVEIRIEKSILNIADLRARIASLEGEIVQFRAHKAVLEAAIARLQEPSA